MDLAVAHIEKMYGAGSVMGLQARLMSQALHKLAAPIGSSRTCAIFINQIRDRIGVMFGNPETTPGGKALKFSASVRLDIRRIPSIKEGDVLLQGVLHAKPATPLFQRVGQEDRFP